MTRLAALVAGLALATCGCFDRLDAGAFDITPETVGADADDATTDAPPADDGGAADDAADAGDAEAAGDAAVDGTDGIAID